MSQVDIAGSVIAYQVANGRVVTVAVNDFRFIAPVLVGDLVSCYARIERIGRTSVTVAVEARVTREPDLDHSHKVAEASITYVAIDRNRLPRPIDTSASQSAVAGNSE